MVFSHLGFLRRDIHFSARGSLVLSSRHLVLFSEANYFRVCLTAQEELRWHCVLEECDNNRSGASVGRIA